jgi:dolichol-phosphate mannosyltransferase
VTRRALVTGATGFVGANLVRRLVRDGHQVHLLVRPEHLRWRIADLAGGVSLHQVSLLDPPRLRRALREIRPEWIFHLAAFGAYPWQTDPERILATNYVATVRFVRLALELGFQALVNAGSSSEYGYRSDLPAESELPEPDSEYAAAKAAATLYCSYAARRHSAPITTLRLYSVFGPYEDPRRLMPALAVEGLRGRLPPLADPATARDFVHVEDVCDAFVRAAEQPERSGGAVFNVGSGRQWTLAQVVELARRELGIEQLPSWRTLEPRPWDTGTWVARPGEIRSALGWAPTHSLELGFRALVGWLRDNPALRRHYEEQRAEVGGPDQKPS